MQGQAELGDLRVQNVAADAVHAYAIIRVRHRGNQAHDFVLGITKPVSEQERAVLAAAPGDYDRSAHD